MTFITKYIVVVQIGFRFYSLSPVLRMGTGLENRYAKMLDY